ncbi:MAG: hypothetical protein FJZ96_08245 [Chloroflexi bacterium]|nr:hypothetical protein [Chloroflexota bacterium]
MTDLLVQVIFGWPSMIASLLLAATGVFLKRPVLLLVGAAFFIAPAWYLGGTPSIRWFGALLPLFILCSAWSVKKGWMIPAWLLLLAPAGACVWLACLVLSQ